MCASLNTLCKATIFCYTSFSQALPQSLLVLEVGFLDSLFIKKEIKLQEPQSCNITMRSCPVDANEWLSYVTCPHRCKSDLDHNKIIHYFLVTNLALLYKVKTKQRNLSRIYYILEKRMVTQQEM